MHNITKHLYFVKFICCIQPNAYVTYSVCNYIPCVIVVTYFNFFFPLFCFGSK